MKLRTILAASAIAALAAPAAAVAQTPDPVGGGTEIGGSVNSFLELIVTQPTKGFAAFSKAKSYEMSFDAQATASDTTTLLSIADGDATSGSKLGHISVGSKRLPSPLEASSTTSAACRAMAPRPLRWSTFTTRRRTRGPSCPTCRRPATTD